MLNISEDIGKRMKISRGEKKINELAKRLGICPRTLSGYESGRTDVPAYVVVYYAKRFNVSLDYLCYGNEFSNTELCQEFAKLSPKLKKAIMVFIKYCNW